MKAMGGQPQPCLKETSPAGRTAEFLEGDHRVVKVLVLRHLDYLILTLADDDARVTPAEVVHAPEGVDWEEE